MEAGLGFNEQWGWFGIDDEIGSYDEVRGDLECCGRVFGLQLGCLVVD